MVSASASEVLGLNHVIGHLQVFLVLLGVFCRCSGPHSKITQRVTLHESVASKDLWHRQGKKNNNQGSTFGHVILRDAGYSKSFSIKKGKNVEEEAAAKIFFSFPTHRSVFHLLGISE